MKISYLFYSLKDLSDLSFGERLIEILTKYGLVVNKTGAHEPVREAFMASNLPEMWKGMGSNGEYSSCYFLFKGEKAIKFSGMVIWNVNLHPNTKSFNCVYLHLNIQKKYDVSRLVQLADDIFAWSEAAYGYITEDSKDPTNNIALNLHDGLLGLMWVNYFGLPYLNEPDFRVPDNYVPISHGVKVILAEKPNDEVLNDFNFLEGIKSKIGMEWFWHHPRRYNKRVPLFDKSAITKK